MTRVENSSKNTVIRKFHNDENNCCARTFQFQRDYNIHNRANLYRRLTGTPGESNKATTLHNGRAQTGDLLPLPLLLRTADSGSVLNEASLAAHRFLAGSTFAF